VATPPENRKTLGRFELIRELGRGNFGRVWLAKERGGHGFERRVALKILNKLDDERRWQALIREARICGRLNHPNIVAVHGVEQVGRVSFIIMEHVDGETLRSIWMEFARLGLRFPRSIVLQVSIAIAEALHHAWSGRNEDGEPFRIVHSDLKPANVILSMRGMAKVADFGLATFGGRSRRRQGHRITGTPSYIAPEVWAGDTPAAPQLDLFALGILIYEMVTGERFYRGAEIAAIPGIIARRTAADEAADVARSFPEIAFVVERLLQRRASARYGSAFDVGEALRGIRAEVGAAGDLVQFLRLVRAGRIPHEQRQGSLGVLPTIPRGATDWVPLLNLVGPPPKPKPDAPATGADDFAWSYTVPPGAIDKLAGVARTDSREIPDSTRIDD